MIKRPETSEGYVYYIRLKTEKGVFYKIGFTKMESVEQRFSYGNSENYKLIDKVLMFKYSMFAYDFEQLLHTTLYGERTYKQHDLINLFRDLSEHPLFRSGQSELYKGDVLGLDPNYKKPFTIFSSPKCDLVKSRRLWFHFHESVKDEEERKHYAALDDFLRSPLFYSKNEYIEENGYWVVSLQRWAIRNAWGPSCITELTTVHGGAPLPTTAADLLAMEEFEPKWGYIDSIPKEIRHLQNLKKIKIQSSLITSIPDELYELKNLKILVLCNTGVKSLSGDIKKLVSLETLNIEYSKELLDLPTELESLPNLKEIVVSEENYERLREFFPNRPQLVRWNNFFDD